MAARVHTLFAGIICALLPLALCLAGAGCRSSANSGREELVLDTCERITNAFRGFHRDSFPVGYWTCEDGVLRSIAGKRIDLITREKFEDFDLQLDWKLAPGGNSGIFIGVTEATAETYWSGPEMQINDDVVNPDGQNPKTSAGALYDLIAPNEKKRVHPTGQYNHARVLSRAGHLEYWLNGEKIVEYDWDSPAMRDLINASKFKDAPFFMKNRDGFIGLQSEGDEVWFRNIRIRRL
ncbi:MAG: DUF1080 domain-containing protein [Limisphaerales bacterium]